MHRTVAGHYPVGELSALDSYPSRFGSTGTVNTEITESPSAGRGTNWSHGDHLFTDSAERAESSGDNGYLLQEQQPVSLFLTCSHPHHPPFPAYVPYHHGKDFPHEKKSSLLDVRESLCRDLINGLPDELLCKIFSFLPKSCHRSLCASVSMRWLRLQSHMRREEFKFMVESESDTDTSAELRERTSYINERTGGPNAKLNLGATGEISEKRVERQPEWAIGHLSRCLEGKNASDIRLTAIAVGTGTCGGLGKLCIRGGPVLAKERGVTDFGLSAIGICCCALKTLSLWDCPFVGDESLIAIANGCRLLKKLDLLKCPAVGDAGLQAIARNCSFLSQLSLEQCGLIGNTSIKAIGDHCTALLCLCICGCPLVGDEGLIEVVTHSRKLKRMKLNGIYIGDGSLAAMACYCESLSFLSLGNLELVSEGGFLHLSSASAVPSLKHLHICNCPGLTDCVLGMLGVSYKGLKHLSLVKCDKVTDEGITVLLQTVAALEILQLERCGFISNKGLSAALTSSNSLKELQIKKCANIDDEGLFAGEFHVSMRLKSICLANCRHLGNKCLSLIGHACNNVTDLDLSGLVTINDDGLRTLFRSGNMRLESINLSGCIRLTDQAVSFIVKMCGKSLQSLFLDGCMLVTDKSLKFIANHCTNLQDLDVSQCSVTDQGVMKILVKRGHGLSSLNLSGCACITERILPLIARKCKSLVGLNLKHCQGLSRDVLDSFESQIWRCDFFCS